MQFARLLQNLAVLNQILSLRREDTLHFSRNRLFVKPLLQQIQEGAGIENPTFNLLEGLIAIARHILTTGISLRQFVALATYLYTTKDPLDFDLLKEWIRQLHMQRMVQLEGNLLVELFNFPAKRIPFTQAAANKTTRKLVNELFSTKGTSKHITYYPSEALTNFTSNLIQNLQNIEE